MSTMASENSYLGGDPVYRGGSSAPTMGTVDPMGYINRELNKPSQTRSGIAQAALSRLQVPEQQPNQAAPSTPVDPNSTLNFVISPTGQLIPAPTGNPIDLQQSQPQAPSNPGALQAAALQRLLGSQK